MKRKAAVKGRNGDKIGRRRRRKSKNIIKDSREIEGWSCRVGGWYLNRNEEGEKKLEGRLIKRKKLRENGEGNFDLGVVKKKVFVLINEERLCFFAFCVCVWSAVRQVSIRLCGKIVFHIFCFLCLFNISLLFLFIYLLQLVFLNVSKSKLEITLPRRKEEKRAHWRES